MKSRIVTPRIIAQCKAAGACAKGYRWRNGKLHREPIQEPAEVLLNLSATSVVKGAP